MSRLDELPPDQRAALSLLLRQRKGYAEVASLLGISERAVHDRAHAALAVLAPRQARAVSAAERLEIGDYLLGQQPGVAERLRTRTLLAGSPGANAWASELAAQLTPLAGADLPEIPALAGTPAVASTPAAAAPPSSAAPRAPEPQRVGELRSSPAGGPGADGGAKPARSSRTGGAILLAVLIAAVIVAVVLITQGGGSGKATSTTNASSTTASTAKSSTSTGPQVTNEIKLTPPNGKSRSTGKVDILVEGSKRAFFIVAEHIPRSKGFYYAIWLYNSHTSSLPLSKSPAVGSTHSFEGGAELPSNAADYHQILVTRETSGKPTHPGHVVLRAAFSLTR